ncbi:hypothetical protein K450DRAFT_249178 [Umbelopsis ramanniana AG]|uniref:Glycerophosphocholine acyltransferase 1 n=1 Tax=Umbelopsis ramanniana AG TaxID=1314678 RepID=A0AAD5E5Q6_UMBRA|nr:uncharacterized protein K450DRAFT_249178 [Umbelopsis ramanniana AG]KAI8577948.1 hypothetical protein K450DRAFT_249178 [Umbelopsis ramanniana AG]
MVMQAQQLEGDPMIEPEMPKNLRKDTADSLSEFFDEPLDMAMPDWTASSDFVSDNDFDMIDMLSVAIDQVTAQINEKKQEFRAKSNQWKSKTTETLRSQTKRLEIKRSELQQRLIKQYASINDRMNRDTKTVQLRDKFSFVVGVGNACVSPVVVARFPDWVPIYYTLQSAYLFPLRIFIYKSRGWHYFIFDLCYYVNALALLYIWVFSSSRYLFISVFCLSNGPVAWAIITWRNSLVFHSLDKVTSVFIHIFPALVSYVIRWMPELASSTSVPIMTAYRDKRFPALSGEDNNMSLKECMVISTLVYIIWQTLYFIFIMVQRREKVEKGLRLTSYSWLLDDRHGRKGIIQKAAFALGAQYKLQMFMLLQLTYNMFTVLPTVFLYQHFKLHSAFLIIMFAVSVWNGASYYIEVFSRRYILEVERKSAKKAASESELLTKKEEEHKQQDVTEETSESQHLKSI